MYDIIQAKGIGTAIVPEGSIEFEWDPAKADSNRRKHRVSFDEAESVFDDDLASIQEDERHSEVEQRE